MNYTLQYVTNIILEYKITKAPGMREYTLKHLTNLHSWYCRSCVIRCKDYWTKHKVYCC